MNPVPLRGATGKYALATGEAADYRLRILHELYGAGTRRVLLESGLRGGMRVADLGCGVGLVTALLAELVGPGGYVVGIDSSGAQLDQARDRVNTDGAHVRFIEASATATGLPLGSFDLVYCRFLLIHLPEPERALREMFALLKPNGILVCEDGDLTASGSEPPSALDAFADLWGRLGPRRPQRSAKASSADGGSLPEAIRSPSSHTRMPSGPSRVNISRKARSGSGRWIRRKRQ